MPSACRATSQRSRAVAFKSAQLRKRQSAAIRFNRLRVLSICGLGNCPCASVFKEGGNVNGKRRLLVVDNRVFRGRPQFRAYLVGCVFRVLQAQLGGGLVPATCRTSTTCPPPSRYLAVKVLAVSTIRGEPSPAVVTGAVRVLPAASFHFAKVSPLRVNSSAPRRQRLRERLASTEPMLLPFAFCPLVAVQPRSSTASRSAASSRSCGRRCP